VMLSRKHKLVDFSWPTHDENNVGFGEAIC